MFTASLFTCGLSQPFCVKMEILSKLKEFIDFINNPPKENVDEKLLKLIDEIFYVFYQIPDRSDDNEYPDPPKHEYEKKYKELRGIFNDYGYYNIPDNVCTKIADTKMNVGDAIDDIADLYFEFSDFIWRYENTSENDAIWYFKNPNKLHWEEHLRDLQYYLFKKIDEESYTEPDA